MEGDQRDTLLKLMKILESSNGSNLKHKPANTGETAVGPYGLMPSTAQDVLKRSKDNVNDLSEDEIADKLKADPNFENKVTDALSKLVQKNTDGQLDREAVAWRDGQYSKHNVLDNTLQNDDDYTNKIDKAKLQLNVMPTLLNTLKAR